MNILLVMGLAAIWLAFAPVNLGGQVSYVMVNGSSMEPGFHKGDLAIVRQAAAYQVGDIVTYRNADMNADVIHRIIGIEGDHFLIQGDNNSWIDGYRPTQAEIVGKLWLHLPQLGKVVEWVRSPLNMALIAGLLGGFFMLTMIPKKSGKKGKKVQPAGNPAGMFEMALYLFAFLALVFGGLAVFAFTRPVTRSADPIEYQQNGFFFYSAAGAPGVYDGDAAGSGEPVFTKLTCTLNLGFTYILVGEQLDNIRGEQQLSATLRDEQSGWSRSIPLASAQSFNGNTHTSLATLDLCQVQALVADVAEKTGFRPSAGTLDIAAQVSAGGIMAGQEFTDTFEPHLNLKFDSLHFYLPGAGSKTDPLKTTQPGTLANPEMVDNTTQLLGLNLKVGGLRGAATIGLAVALVGLLVLGLYYIAVSKYSQETVIHIKSGGVIMDVYTQGLQVASPVIDVTRMEDLVKLAERQNGMILHLPDKHANYYILQLDGTTYRYVTGKGGAVATRFDRFWLWLSRLLKG